MANQIFKIFIFLALLIQIEPVFAEKTLVLAQKTHVFGLTNVYINNNGIKITTSQPRLNIYCLTSNNQIYYVNLNKKIYFLTDRDHFPRPKAVSYIRDFILKAYDSPDNSNIWQVVKPITFQNLNCLLYKLKPNTQMQKNTIKSTYIIYATFDNCNHQFYKIYCKSLGIPYFDHQIALAYTAYTDVNEKLELIQTNSISYINSNFKLPNLKQYKQVNTEDKIFEYGSKVNSMTDLIEFMK